MQIATLSILVVSSFGFSGFQEPQIVAEPQRIALTPVLDGKFDPSEWDSYSGAAGKESFFQWEPGRVYAASKLGENEDLLVSVDAGGDGWLIGKSNYEFRISFQEGKPVLRTRGLDASNANGPAWTDAIEFARQSVVASEPIDGGRFVECAIDDSGANLLKNKSGKLGIRVDVVPTGQEFEPFLPRTMTASELVMDRGSNLPGGLRWSPNFLSRNVIAGQTMKVRFHFNGDPTMKLTRLEVNALQKETDAAAKLSYPFPQFNGKGHTAVDFTTPIPSDASTGYRTIKSQLTDAAGNTSILTASYRVAPLIELSFNEPRNLKASPKDRKIKFSYFVHSNSLNRVNAEVKVQVPTTWKLESSEVAPVVIYNSYSGQKRTFEVVVPAGASGNFPVTIVAKVGEKEFQDSGWIRIL